MNKSTQIFDRYACDYDAKFNQNPAGKYQRDRVQEEIAPFLLSAGRICDTGSAESLPTSNLQPPTSNLQPPTSPPAARILDVGCGPGSDFVFYRQQNLAVDAIDISGEMCKLARQKAAQLKLKAVIKETDLRNFQASKKYDAIILNFGVANALANLPEMLQKLHGMLKEAGVLIIVVMPPFHLFSALEALIKGRLRAFWHRVFQHRATLNNGFEIRYFRQRDFTRDFRLIKRVHLAHLLPTPDQFQRFSLAKRLFKLLRPLDRAAAKLVPDWWGGDHVCYVLRKQ